MSKQSQAFVKESVYQTVLVHNFDSPVALAVNTGAFPATADKVVLSAASVVRAMQPFGISSIASGNGSISLDDANDRIMLEPGVYEVEVSAALQDVGVDSNFSVALTTAAQASNDVSLASVSSTILTAGQVYSLHLKRLLVVTAPRALELHLAAVTASGAISMRAGSFLSVKRLGNIE